MVGDSRRDRGGRQAGPRPARGCTTGRGAPASWTRPGRGDHLEASRQDQPPRRRRWYRERDPGFGALIAVASDLCARVSEVAALRSRDVTAAEDGSATVEVWAVKTGTARTGYLRASTIRRVRAWTRWGRVKGRAMTPRAVADVIRIRAAACNLDASGHSLRVGAAVSMASRGASLVAMQAAGGWRPPPPCPPTTADRPAPAGGPSRHFARKTSEPSGLVPLPIIPARSAQTARPFVRPSTRPRRRTAAGLGETPDPRRLSPLPRLPHGPPRVASGFRPATDP